MSSAAPAKPAAANDKSSFRPFAQASSSNHPTYVPIRPRPLLPKPSGGNASKGPTNGSQKPVSISPSLALSSSSSSASNSTATSDNGKCSTHSGHNSTNNKLDHRRPRKSSFKDRKPVIKKRAKSANAEGSGSANSRMGGSNASGLPVTVAPASLISKRRKSPPSSELASLLSSSAPSSTGGPVFFKDNDDLFSSSVKHGTNSTSSCALRASKRNANVMLSSCTLPDMSILPLSSIETGFYDDVRPSFWGQSTTNTTNTTTASSDKEDNDELNDDSPLATAFSIEESLVGALTLTKDNFPTATTNDDENDDLSNDLLSLDRYLTPEIDEKPFSYDSLEFIESAVSHG